MPLPTNNTQPPKKRSRPLRLLVCLLVIVAICATLAANRQTLYDEYKLYGYNPPSTVATLATQDTMTPQARRIFYVNHPTIGQGNGFSQPCPNDGGEQTIVLGCYHGGQAGIYVLNVTDPLLDGVEQVTAAHEMLHAAYGRLSSKDRAAVDAMLMNYYQHGLTDQRIISTIDAYKKSEPNDVVNEMHSVFGTEVASLPAGLEQYYKQYFTDRSKVTGFAAKYQAEFTSRQTQVAQDDAKLDSLKTQISNLEDSLKSQIAAINSQQAKLVSERSSGQIAAYNAAVPAYNRQVDVYNSSVQQVQDLIDQYNNLVTSRNNIALEEDHLAKELSSAAAKINK